ncbi:hypothetical protein GINT2_001498 [Glugoides intestinalis]
MSSELENFLDTDVRVFFSSANHVQLVKNIENGAFSYRSKFSDAGNKKYKSKFKVSKNGMKYSIRLDGEYLCNIEKKELKASLTQCLWKIIPKKLGFIIEKDDECITAAADSTLKLDKCTSTEDQLFDFEALEDCKKDQGDSKVENDSKQQKEVILKIYQEEALKLPIFNEIKTLKTEKNILQQALAQNSRPVEVTTESTRIVNSNEPEKTGNNTKEAIKTIRYIPPAVTTTVFQILKDSAYIKHHHHHTHDEERGYIKFI